MKFFRPFLCFLIVFSILFTIFIGKDKILEQDKITKKAEYKGIITLWQIDGFEGGSDSRKQFLLKVAREFEKQNQGVLIMVISHTFLSAKENMEKGVFPDLISFSNGAFVNEMENLKVKKAVAGGKVGDKIYATAWCRGGYVLIKNPNAKNKQTNTIIVSQKEYTQPLIALALEGMEFDNIKVYSPLDAYVNFTLGKEQYFLATQRDVVRLTNRNFEFEISPLTEFNDLYQYISLTSKDKNKKAYAKAFIDYLLLDKVQKRLNEISMFSPFVEVAFENENLNKMQKINAKKTISAFTPTQILLQMQSDGEEGLKGNQNALNKIKKLLI
jgi:hypothetical protein